MKTKEIKTIEDILKEVANFCEGSLINEVCGLIGFNGEQYIFQEGNNIATDPKNNFVLDPLQYLLFKSKYETIAIFHSHLIGDEEPSDFDVLMSENSCVPFCIYSLNTKKYYIHTPKDAETGIELLGKLKEKIIKHNTFIND